MPRPMLALPMGRKDWIRGIRWNFLKSCAPILDKLGWCIGVEVKGLVLEGWAEDCFNKIKALGGRVTWHPPTDAIENMDKMEFVASQANNLIDFGLEAVTIHLPPLFLTSQPLIETSLKRYNSSVDAGIMLEHIKSQVKILVKLNKKMGGILQIENVSLISWSKDENHRLTYLALRAGSWLDIAWISKEVGVKTTFDSEHYNSARNLLMGMMEDDLCRLSRWRVPSSAKVGEDAYKLHSITGYWLKKGLPPVAYRQIGLIDYIELTQPTLFHLGGGTHDVNEKGEYTSHLPIDLCDPYQINTLDLILRKIRETNAIGAVVEVCGRSEEEWFGYWSPRIENDEVAKMHTYLTVMNEISRVG
ncbi:MAG: hypothetical protein US31_C0002G0126 [Berkelbacteria bacterium GW2011_GWA1_36_9]|uniref:Xylose isomerase-like TIM barrel domain-containing protein n=1 Tax=Berkelbacteria bacterium GW2011_GWA1_36_9 TaxID=1618331 RepID=A0A0G0IS00_9BACT|nr:MAG: hypothetical protein US31_C0002G0126 [Berkelbacteria bacterium GW2011_GWA1_36_9]